ncbi:MAG: ATP-binding protein [Pseudomonadota bacterium]
MTTGVGGASSARRALTFAAVAAAIVAALAAWAAWTFAYDRAVSDAARDADAKLRFAAETLEKDFVRYKLLAKALSQTGAVRRRAILDFDGGVDEAANLLERMEAISGAERVSFVTAATARAGAERRAVERAGQGVMGVAFDRMDGGGFVFAAPVWSDGAVVGAVVVRQSAAAMEFAWRALPETLFFTSFEGLVSLSSLPGLRLRTLNSADAPAPARSVRQSGGRTYWRFDDTDWRALGVSYDEAVVQAVDFQALDLTGFILIDAAPPRRAALYAAAMAVVLAIALALAAAIVLQRRAALQARLAIEERAKAELELKVADRTVELTAEVDERRAVARRLRDAQEDLVRAGKLAALGRMAAGIAHEINQPLAAIRGFADNAVTLMERGRGGEARENLNEISGLTERAARIIRNLRAFARNEAEEASPVSIDDAVEGALTILSARIREEGAEVAWVRPDTAVFVIAGAVRLQQIIINLVTNALDAQRGAAAPKAEIALERDGATATLRIRDWGDGLTEEARDKLFEPFHSTKGDEAEGGLGLGLAISYGLARSFGGELRGDNHPEGGAVFSIRLRRAEAARAAA